jgi:hypothetical protein
MHNIPEQNGVPPVCASVVVHTVDIIQLIDVGDGTGKDGPICRVDGM